jgi:ATP-dependent exoDNAse (exonuclease V) alpha subunit
VAALLGQLRRGTQRLPDQAVLEVDEAGMVSTRDLAELLDWIEDARGKLVLVGDHHQLPELEAGGSFRGLVQRGLAIELSDNLRQVHAWERRALDHVREGRANRALALYDEHRRITVEPSNAETRERMVDDWLDTGDLDRAVMVGH